MNEVPRELPKEYVKSQNFASTAEIMETMKEMFRDIIQAVMEVELGRERCQQDIAEQIKELYDVGISPELVQQSRRRSCLRSQPGRISRWRRCIPTDVSLHCASDSFLHPLRQLKGYQIGGGPKANLHFCHPG